DLKQLQRPTPHTPDVTWSGVTVDEGAKPPTVTVSGSAPTGPITLTTNAETGKILRLTAGIQTRSGESQLELTSHPVDPGDPAAGGPRTEGRERVNAVAELRPNPPKKEGPGEPEPPKDH